MSERRVVVKGSIDEDAVGTFPAAFSMEDGAELRDQEMGGPRMRRTSLAVAALLASSPALAFDTGMLGQGGTLSLADLMPTIAKSAPLQREVRQALIASKKTADDVTCDGMRFPGQWVHLGGLRVAPYTCDFGGKWLQ